MPRVMLAALIAVAAAASLASAAPVARRAERVCVAAPLPGFGTRTPGERPTRPLHRLYRVAFNRLLALYGLNPEAGARRRYRGFLRAQLRYADAVYRLQVALGAANAGGDAADVRALDRAASALGAATFRVVTAARRLGAPACGVG